MRLALLLLAAVALGLPVEAQRAVEVGAEMASLSGAYADGSAVSARLTLPRRTGWTRFDAGIVDRFGDRALVYGAAGTYHIAPRWIVVGAAGGSTAGLAHPRVQASLGLARRWGPEHRVVTTATLAVQDARDVHRDVSAIGEATIYGDGVIAQVGARATLSQPGDALGGGAYAAVTVGDPAGRHAVGRIAAAHEAYLLVGPVPTDVGFRSGEASATWHQPLSGPWSATLGAGLYLNPYYTRVGVRTGLTRRF